GPLFSRFVFSTNYLPGPLLEDTRDIMIDITNLKPYALEFTGQTHSVYAFLKKMQSVSVLLKKSSGPQEAGRGQVEELPW
ncbi:hypothetical protein ACQP3L_36785, partial [Escherichia coli]